MPNNVDKFFALCAYFRAMKTFVTIHHTAFVADAATYATTQFELDSVVALDADAVRELAFELTNAPQECLSSEKKEIKLNKTGRAYSASVGDLVEIKSKFGFYGTRTLAIIANCGFKEIAGDENVDRKLESLKVAHVASGFRHGFYSDASK